ncbi:carboxyltransferase domain-containing protein [Defluviimonas aestuarii]|uniref:5-oxoprolinase subunit B family protein n=1 Tax=Albidovulum aestuarii TaxID=1130726 RepID=UPI00249C0B63|nr:carboxyltransferase domain-containing protein [Defluviimonas aestuarii]MDI3335695.1 carboxyltransferase domain-containing protein [Defluviimonas aestuarii]
MTNPDSSGMRAPQWPRLSPLGSDGLLVSFGERLEEAANRAALAFRAAVDRAGMPGVAETATSLASTYLRLEPALEDRARVMVQVQALLAGRDWFAAALPENRKLWRIPCLFGTDRAPQLAEAAAEAGLTPDEAVRSIAETRVRVQTIGFAPGQPYLGELSPEWDIPRQTQLTERIPVGALCVAIRQLVLFPVSTPTGWRHIGQTAFRAFRPDAADPFPLRPGDEVIFEPVTADDYSTLEAAGPDGGALSELLP